MSLCMWARFEFWHTTVPLCTWMPSNAFLFVIARTLCRYVCELASSSNIRLCLCAHECPAMLSRRKELMLFCYVSGNVLILEFNLNGDSPIIMSFPSTCIFLSIPCPQTCWSTRVFFVLISLSWLLRTCNHELISPWSCSQPFEK
jgi:hypothetical protein